jgi:hypothetical protein
MQVRYGEPGTLTHCWWEGKFVQPLWKEVWRFLKKLKIEFPFCYWKNGLENYLSSCIWQKNSSKT